MVHTHKKFILWQRQLCHIFYLIHLHIGSFCLPGIFRGNVGVDVERIHSGALAACDIADFVVADHQAFDRMKIAAVGQNAEKLRIWFFYPVV